MHQMRPIKKFWTLFRKINKYHLKTHKIFNGTKNFYQISLKHCLKMGTKLVRHLKRTSRAVDYGEELESYK
jgi:hypothetical protein